MDPADIEDLFDQLEDYSDSGPDADTISIGSTPKPSLKPFFCSSRNLLHEARSVVAAAAVVKAQSKSKSFCFHEKNEMFSQCGKFRIFLSLRFYVKSTLENLDVQKRPF